jgi:probable phosphoglycerate mutase
VTDYTLVFDGGSLGNPGRGYGSYRVTRNGDGKQKVRRLEFGDHVTNNVAEYRALIAGLEDVAAMVKDDGKGPVEYSVQVLGDSKLVVEQVAGRWKVRAEGLKPLRDRAAALLGSFSQASGIRWQPRSASLRVLGH